MQLTSSRFRCERLVLITLALLTTGKRAHAVPITIVQTGQGSGSLGGTNFVNARFTLTGFSDTSTRVPLQSSPNAGYWLINSSSTIAIDGVGVFQFLSPSTYFVNNTGHIAGYDYSQSPSSFPFPKNQYDLFYSPIDPAFSTWDFSSSIGPL